MDRRPAPPAPPPGGQDRPPTDLLPAPLRRVGGVVVLTLTLWLASFLALVR
jgi:hypothetical protein